MAVDTLQVNPEKKGARKLEKIFRVDCLGGSQKEVRKTNNAFLASSTNELQKPP